MSLPLLDQGPYGQTWSFFLFCILHAQHGDRHTTLWCSSRIMILFHTHLNMNKLRLTEIRRLAWSHVAHKWQSWWCAGQYLIASSPNKQTNKPKTPSICGVCQFRQCKYSRGIPSYQHASLNLKLGKDVHSWFLWAGVGQLRYPMGQSWDSAQAYGMLTNGHSILDS